MKVLLINPWQKTLYGDDKSSPGHPHLGLAYLVAVLKKNGIDQIAIFDQGLENNDALLFERINAFKPDLIGITSFSYSIEFADSLIREIKKHTTTPVVIGGAHVSAVRGKVLEETVADFAMYGECEQGFLQFIRELSGNRRFHEVGNLIWRDITGTILENPALPWVEDLDSLPFPDFDAFDFQRYNYSIAKKLPIITSRGCPYKCNYCSVKLSMGRGFRKRSPESVVAEMKHWIQHFGIQQFEVNDDCFSLDLKRAEAICDKIIEEKLGITYEMYNGIRADRVSEPLLRKMKASGCVFISYGCESGDQDVITAMGKNLKLEKVRQAVELTRKVGIRNSVNFIIGHKSETFEKAMKTIEFAKSLPTDFVNFYNVVAYPGTDLYTYMKDETKQLIDDKAYLASVGSRNFEPIFETPEFPREERIRAMQIGNALYERSILTFRFGKVLGTLAYWISRNRWLFTLGRRIALENRVGFFIYGLLTTKSRQ